MQEFKWLWQARTHLGAICRVQTSPPNKKNSKNQLLKTNPILESWYLSMDNNQKWKTPQNHVLAKSWDQLLLHPEHWDSLGDLLPIAIGRTTGQRCGGRRRWWMTRPRANYQIGWIIFILVDAFGFALSFWNLIKVSAAPDIKRGCFTRFCVKRQLSRVGGFWEVILERWRNLVASNQQWKLKQDHNAKVFLVLWSSTSCNPSTYILHKTVCVPSEAME